MSQCCVHLMTFGCSKGLTSVSAGLRLLAAVVIGICASTGSVLAADASLDDIKVIRIVPRTAEEIARAHERARGDACEPIPSAQPLEIKSFTPILTERDSREWENGKLLLPSSRRHMFTVGLDMLSSDRSQLPRVSGGQILDYIRGHYVTVQARIQKDPVTSELFLHHRPLAATVAFGRGGLTQEFTDAVLAAVRDFHSLGIYLPRGNDPSPKNLRTLVMTYRSYVAPPTPTSGRTSLRSNYEYVFVRGRSDKDTKSGELDLHIFATSEQRKKIHYFFPLGHSQAAA